MSLALPFGLAGCVRCAWCQLWPVAAAGVECDGSLLLLLVNSSPVLVVVGVAASLRIGASEMLF